MNWLLCIVLCVALVEMVVRLPLEAPVKSLLRSSNRAVRVAKAPGISDHWKEKAMATYALRTFTSTMTIALYLAVVLGTATVLVVGLERVSSGFQEFILSWVGLGYSILVASAYFLVRKAVLHD